MAVGRPSNTRSNKYNVLGEISTVYFSLSLPISNGYTSSYYLSNLIHVPQHSLTNFASIEIFTAKLLQFWMYEPLPSLLLLVWSLLYCPIMRLT